MALIERFTPGDNIYPDGSSTFAVLVQFFRRWAENRDAMDQVISSTAATEAVAQVKPDTLQHADDPSVIFGVTDEDGLRTWVEVAPDGGPTSHAAEKIVPAVTPAVSQAVGLSDMDSELNGLSVAVTDEDGLRTWLEADLAGAPSGHSLSLLRDGLALTDPAATPLARLRPAGDGQVTLVYEDPTAAVTRTVHTADTITDVTTAAGVVSFTAATGGTITALTYTARDGLTRPTAPVTALAAWGDSMTFGLNGGGTTWPATCAADLGITHYNGGVSSQTSTEIAIRQGGIVPAVAALTIPASGTVGVTLTDPPGQFRSDYQWTFTGTLAGVAGTLTKATGDTWTFTRTTTGSTVNVPAGSLFRTDTGTPYQDRLQVFWVGRNNPTRDTIVRDIVAMAANLTPYITKYLVVSVCNTSTETLGTAGHSNILAINTALAAAYGPRYVDLRRHLIDNGLAAAGITATTQDTTDMGNDIIPASLRSDSIHLNATGYAVAGHYIADIIREKGWA